MRYQLTRFDARQYHYHIIIIIIIVDILFVIIEATRSYIVIFLRALSGF